MRTVSININRRCPLKCKHCSMGFSDSYHGDRFEVSADDLTRMIASLDPDVYDMVLMAGGEPSLSPAVIRAGIAACRERRLISSIVTAPVWAPSAEAAVRFLDRIDGLDLLLLSYDDYHLEFLSRDHYMNAAVAALGRSMRVVFQIAYSNTAERDALRSSLDGLVALGAYVHDMRTVAVGNALHSTFDVERIEISEEADLLRIPRGCMLGNAFIDDARGVHGCCWSTAAEASPFSRAGGLGAALSDAFADLEASDVFQSVRRHGLIDGLTDQGRAEVVTRVRGETFATECDLCLRLMRAETSGIWRTCIRPSHEEKAATHG